VNASSTGLRAIVGSVLVASVMLDAAIAGSVMDGSVMDGAMVPAAVWSGASDAWSAVVGAAVKGDENSVWILELGGAIAAMGESRGERAIVGSAIVGSAIVDSAIVGVSAAKSGVADARDGSVLIAGSVDWRAIAVASAVAGVMVSAAVPSDSVPNRVSAPNSISVPNSGSGTDGAIAAVDEVSSWVAAIAEDGCDGAAVDNAVVAGASAGASTAGS